MKIRRDLGIGSESKVSVDGCLERLKVLSCRKDGPRKSVPVSRSHRDKRIDECVCLVSFRFKRVGILEKCVFRANEAFGGIINFISPEQKPWISIKN